LFRIAEQYIGTVYALLSVSLLVSLLTLASTTDYSIIGVFSIFLLSAFWCGLYVWTRNIWVVGIHHAAWNYTEFSFGILDEHWRISAPLEISINGPSIITGGSWGPEGSIISVVICLLGLSYLYSRTHLLPRVSAKAAYSQAIFNAEAARPDTA